MELTDKRFWSGEKTVYYPAFKFALKDSLLFSVSWVGIICLCLSAICLIIHFTNGADLTWYTISFALIFLFAVFVIFNGMFLYENWCKQKYVIGKIKKLLPEGYCAQIIDFYSENKKYTMRVDYRGRIFKITVVYPVLTITEKGYRATAIRLDSKKETLERWRSLILNYMTFSKYHCTVCGLPLGFAPWGKDKNSPTYNICPCCGVEWGNEDYTTASRTEYRNKWLAAGAKWFEPQKKPANWNLEEQLNNIEQYETDK